MVYYNILFILPLVIILLLASDKSVLEKMDFWQKQKNRTIKLVGGLLMIGFGVLIFLI
ncbi:hypothetical protein HY227_01840 [Candidatus Wolfebacteria bacterium]|nr:hypothetical protein [Candidatus Wolfebacteria bacterium]